MENESVQINTKQPKSSLFILGGVIILLIIGAAVFILSSLKNTSNEEKTGVVSSEQASTNPPSPSSNEETGVKTINIQASSYFYNPEEIREKVGETVKIVLTADDTTHNFNIDEFGVKIPTIEAGNTASVEFTPDTIGEFEYYCSVGQHRQLGQVGTLIVED